MYNWLYKAKEAILGLVQGSPYYPWHSPGRGWPQAGEAAVVLWSRHLIGLGGPLMGHLAPGPPPGWAAPGCSSCRCWFSTPASAAAWRSMKCVRAWINWSVRLKRWWPYSGIVMGSLSYLYYSWFEGSGLVLRSHYYPWPKSLYVQLTHMVSPGYRVNLGLKELSPGLLASARARPRLWPGSRGCRSLWLASEALWLAAHRARPWAGDVKQRGAEI